MLSPELTSNLLILKLVGAAGLEPAALLMSSHSHPIHQPLTKNLARTENPLEVLETLPCLAMYSHNYSHTSFVTIMPALMIKEAMHALPRRASESAVGRSTFPLFSAQHAARVGSASGAKTLRLSRRDSELER